MGEIEFSNDYGDLSGATARRGGRGPWGLPRSRGGRGQCVVRDAGCKHAHDRAFEEAIEAARVHFHSEVKFCPECGAKQ